MSSGSFNEICPPSPCILLTVHHYSASSAIQCTKRTHLQVTVPFSVAAPDLPRFFHLHKHHRAVNIVSTLGNHVRLHHHYHYQRSHRPHLKMIWSLQVLLCSKIEHAQDQESGRGPS